MHDSRMLWELKGVLGHHQGKLGEVLTEHVIGQVLEIPNEHRKAQSMSLLWNVLFIISWKVAEINIFGRRFLMTFALFKILLEPVVEVNANLLPGIQSWSQLVEETIKARIAAQEVIKLFLKLSIAQSLALIFLLILQLLLNDVNKVDELLVCAHGVHVHVDALFGTLANGGFLLDILGLHLFDEFL